MDMLIIKKFYWSWIHLIEQTCPSKEKSTLNYLILSHFPINQKLQVLSVQSTGEDSIFVPNIFQNILWYHGNKIKVSKYYLHYFGSSMLFYSRHVNQVFERRLCFASDHIDQSTCSNLIHTFCFSTNRWWVQISTQQADRSSSYERIWNSGR